MTASAFLAVALIALAAALIARAVALPRMRALRQLAQIDQYGFIETSALKAGGRPAASLVSRLGGLVGMRVGRERRARIRGQLVAAGLHTTTVDTYFGWYVISGLSATAFMLWFAISTAAPPLLAAVEIAAGVTIGWFLAPVYLSRRGRLRLEQIDKEIPELVDLLLVGIESGMGFHGALRVAAPRVEGPLGEELRLMLQQQALGASTTNALENMLERGETPAVRSFVRTLVQGERHGVSVGQMMRSLGEDMRKHRRSQAEESAHKTPVKILFPLVFLLLPAMLLLILGPAMMNLGRAFA